MEEMCKLKITIHQLKNYLGTGLKFELQNDCHEDFMDLEYCNNFETAFSKGSLWDFVGWSDVEIPLGEGEFNCELLQFEKGVYKGNYRDSKPCFYRLSDLDKFIPELGFVPIEELNTEFGYAEVRLVKYCNGGIGWSIDSGYCNTAIDWSDMYPVIQKIFQWHFWPFGDEYFEEGLLIDKLKHGRDV